MESAAASILKRAVEMDKKEQYTIALVLYHEGVQLLCNVMKELKGDDNKAQKKKYLAQKAEEYVGRAEMVKTLIEKKKSASVQKESKTETKKLSEIHRELIKIESGSTGYGYVSVFGKFLDDKITYIDIEDPYIRSSHQCQNLVRLCELMVQKCCALTRISLLTTYEPQEADQITRLAELKESLASYNNISFNFSFKEGLHDRQITFSSGWVIKIGRGLDYFQPSKGRFVLGSCDLELRPCRETTIDIFHMSQLKDETK